ncbi:MAG: hypothetical protein WBG30_12760 [Psychrilyobacter sp.]|uniref:major capsid protein n=1 Tax=Psychrilyobacter sp. TaxID=2586924 RepID=UPI003C769AD4
MNKRMIWLAALLNAATQKLEVPKTYSSKFEGSGNKYLSPTEMIRVDDMMDHFVVAGIVGRNEVLPILGKDGFSKLEFEPDIIGGEFPYSASDITTVNAGVPTYTTNGKIIDSVKAMEAKYVKMGAAAIVNKFERQCVDAYLKGIYIDKKGKELNVGVKTNKSLALASKIISDVILGLALDWTTKKGGRPKIEVGLTVFNKIKNEANDTKQNINKVSFSYTDTGASLQVGALKIELLVDGIGTDGKVVDTSKMIILSDPKTLAVGYGCLTYGDVKTNETKIIKAEKLAGETRVEATSGSKGIWTKSAPMPVLANIKKYIRYVATGL